VGAGRTIYAPSELSIISYSQYALGDSMPGQFDFSDFSTNVVPTNVVPTSEHGIVCRNFRKRDLQQEVTCLNAVYDDDGLTKL
jgi:hypothetical protein